MGLFKKSDKEKSPKKQRECNFQKDYEDDDYDENFYCSLAGRDFGDVICEGKSKCPFWVGKK